MVRRETVGKEIFFFFFFLLVRVEKENSEELFERELALELRGLAFFEG